MPQKRILIIEDREKFLGPLATHYRLKGYKVTTAKTFSRAKELLTKQRFDEVLTDLYLRHGLRFKPDGIEICKICRENGIPFTLHSTAVNNRLRMVLHWAGIRKARKAGLQIIPKRETMRKIRQKP